MSFIDQITVLILTYDEAPVVYCNTSSLHLRRLVSRLDWQPATRW